jgi:hypothetical protein
MCRNPCHMAEASHNRVLVVQLISLDKAIVGLA